MPCSSCRDRARFEVQRHGQRAEVRHVADGGPVAWPLTDRLRSGGEVDRRLGERVLGFRQADPVQRLGGGDGNLERLGSALPTSSDALMMSRRAMNLGSSPAAIMEASQYSAPSGSLPRRLLMKALTVS
jgi:hypothetical protein